MVPATPEIWQGLLEKPQRQKPCLSWAGPVSTAQGGQRPEGAPSGPHHGPVRFHRTQRRRPEHTVGRSAPTVEVGPHTSGLDTAGTESLSGLYSKERRRANKEAKENKAWEAGEK